ncbi:metallophosphoesterase family protein [Haloprofundus halobius]|uniref:metallophosphoesterase family protein n=1 Tax=Haloprofundus halobius TaxID=2876194 RepID=UPI001CC9003A|nr:metallophosphoesterase family protein [Haloprofundus halobius]
MQVAILGDTHMPSQKEELPQWVQDCLVEADYALHTGDFDSPESYDTVLALTDGMVTAVAGETDPPELDLPEVDTAELEDITFVVTHGDAVGSTSTDTEDSKAAVADAVRKHGGDDAVGVVGHTHEPMDETVDGVRLLNPGSATGADPASRPTMFVVEVEDGEYDATYLPDEGCAFD